MSKCDGKIIKMGDDIDTDIIIPTQHMTLRTIREMSQFAFEPLRPEIPKIVKKGDILLCGKNFGCGSSREQAASIIKELGFSCVIAKSFSRIFFRNALNNGVLVIENSELYDVLEEGASVSFDMDTMTFYYNENEEMKLTGLPDTFMEIFKAGGIVPYWKQKNRSCGGE